MLSKEQQVELWEGIRKKTLEAIDLLQERSDALERADSKDDDCYVTLTQVTPAPHNGENHF